MRVKCIPILIGSLFAPSIQAAAPLIHRRIKCGYLLAEFPVDRLDSTLFLQGGAALGERQEIDAGCAKTC